LWEGRTLLLLAVALALALLVRAVAIVRPGLDQRWLARLAPWMPFAIRLHLGIALAGLLSGGYYLAPAMEIGKNLVGWLLGIVVAVSALLLLVGWHTKVGAWLLIAAGPLGMLEFGFEAILHRVDLLGLALFLVLAGPGRWSADFELGRAREPGLAEVGRAIWALKVAVGSALISVAVSEKLANPELARRFTDEQGVDFNVGQALGLPLADTEFIRIAGAVEVLFGLLIISGALPQAIVLIAGVPFNLTLYFFGTNELLGHLPVYGAMLVLLVYGSDPVLRPLCSKLVPPSAEAKPVGKRRMPRRLRS
ncbi:MAG: hypothetical protein H0V94_07775, partial [Actinobacteria bacterium]|nr:hypothetical protein [Actinomycetota bacterium]